MSFLIADNISFAYEAGVSVVQDASFVVEEGETFALLGPSGSGKTTLLRILAGFERPDRGKIVLGSTILNSSQRCLPPERRDTGVVFQDYALFPHLSVAENIAFGLRSLSREERSRRVMELLTSMELGRYAGRKPQELSGGQQQRVALARALAPRPKLLLLDEAFSSLDPSLKNAVQANTKQILMQSKITSILVTHDQEEALSFADRISVMHSGALMQTGSPVELYENPANSFVAQFIGGANMMPARADGSTAASLLGTVELDKAASGEVTVAVRPEQIAIAETGVEAKILARNYHGHDLTWKMEVDGRPIVVRTLADCPCSPGDKVLLRVESPVVIVES